MAPLLSFLPPQAPDGSRWTGESALQGQPWNGSWIDPGEEVIGFVLTLGALALIPALLLRASRFRRAGVWIQAGISLALIPWIVVGVMTDDGDGDRLGFGQLAAWACAFSFLNLRLDRLLRGRRGGIGRDALVLLAIAAATLIPEWPAGLVPLGEAALAVTLAACLLLGRLLGGLPAPRDAASRRWLLAGSACFGILWISLAALLPAPETRGFGYLALAGAFAIVVAPAALVAPDGFESGSGPR